MYAIRSYYAWVVCTMQHPPRFAWPTRCQRTVEPLSVLRPARNDLRRSFTKRASNTSVGPRKRLLTWSSRLDCNDTRRSKFLRGHHITVTPILVLSGLCTPRSIAMVPKRAPKPPRVATLPKMFPTALSAKPLGKNRATMRMQEGNLSLYV